MRSRLVSVQLPCDGAGLTLPEAQRLRERVYKTAAENDRLKAEILHLAPPKPSIASKIRSYIEEKTNSVKELCKDKG